MEAKRQAEEEARRREEEERKRIEEEEAREREEERLKEEAKQKRKEKEKAKREQLKKEGKLLTKKQKEERAAAEIRRKALLASANVQIEGLQQQQNGQAGPSTGAPKKVVYGSRKKKGPTQQKEKDEVASPVTESKPESVVSTPPPATPEPTTPKEDWEASEDEAEKPLADVKDSWDAPTDEETGAEKAEGVKDSWDASSDEEVEEAPKPAPAKAPESDGKGNVSLIVIAI